MKCIQEGNHQPAAKAKIKPGERGWGEGEGGPGRKARQKVGRPWRRGDRTVAQRKVRVQQKGERRWVSQKKKPPNRKDVLKYIYRSGTGKKIHMPKSPLKKSKKTLKPNIAYKAKPHERGKLKKNLGKRVISSPSTKKGTTRGIYGGKILIEAVGSTNKHRNMFDLRVKLGRNKPKRTHRARHPSKEGANAGRKRGRGTL